MSLNRQSSPARRLRTTTAPKLGMAPLETRDGAPSSRRIEFTWTQREIVLVCAETVQQLGLSRSVGQIFGVIYGSPQPLAFNDVLACLELSKGSVSQGIRFLLDLGAIKLVAIQGDRREHFVAETELRRLLSGVLSTRLQKPLESGIDRLKLIQANLSEADQAGREFLEGRVNALLTWHRNALFVIPFIQRLLRSKAKHSP